MLFQVPDRFIIGKNQDTVVLETFLSCPGMAAYEGVSAGFQDFFLKILSCYSAWPFLRNIRSNHNTAQRTLVLKSQLFLILGQKQLDPEDFPVR
jgi:hypothetical protein